MPKQKLTDRQFISGVTLADLLHFVVTGDTSQNPAGSSYKGSVEQLFNTFSSFTCTYPLIVDTVNSCSGSITINGDVTINGSATTINTQIIQSQDNNIVLNYSGTHLTAIGGGITVEDGQSDGVDSSIFTDSNGTWVFNPGLSASTGSINNFTADTILVTTIGNSGDCVNDLYVSNIHSCSPLNINPLDEGNVYFGSTSGVTIDVINNRIGINTTTPIEELDVSGNTKISGSLNIGTILSGTPIINLGLDYSGNVVTGVTTINTDTFTTGATLNGTVLEFDRNDLSNAYNVDLSGLTGNLLYTQTNNYTLGVPITINHNLNTTDVLVQIVDTNTSQLIYGSVDNYQLNSLDITLNTSLNNVKVLVIGSPVSQIVPKGSIVYTLGHNSISPTDNNNYFIGQNFNLTPSTSSNDGRRFIVQKTGTVTQVSIKRTITGTLGSSETNNFYVNNVTQATQGFITSGETFDSSSSLTNYTLFTPLNVTAGDKLEIEWLTPAWATNPATVRQVFNMIIEY
jgi:hypothetical protein